MYLKSLTLKGFKSFASATTLKFEPGICAVVGPNGSGKSNVVDALAWVMGEQGAKNLRGGKMEDVIFAGAGDRKPLGRAEVTLTIDNSDGALPIEYTEVSVTRRMFRDGGGEYEINGHKARLMDIQELLSDSGIGREMHVIVGQGRLSQILESRPEDRRAFIEEAAGVLKHRRRKEKAQRKLVGMQANLDRLSDLTAELAKQLKPLARQAEAARKAATIQSEVRDARLRIAGYQIHSLASSLKDAQSHHDSIAEKLEEVTEQLEEATGAQLEAEDALGKINPEAEKSQQLWFELSSLAERVSATQRIATDRAKNFSEVRYSGPDPDELAEKAARADAEYAEAEETVDILSERLESIQDNVAELEERAQRADREHLAQVRAIADRREGIVRLLTLESQQREHIVATEAELERLRETESDIAAQARSKDAEHKDCQTQAQEARSRIEPLSQSRDVALNESRAADSRLEQLREQQNDIDKSISRLESKIETLESHRMTRNAVEQWEKLQSFYGVDRCIIPQRGMEKAIAAALGPVAEALVGEATTAELQALDIESLARHIVITPGEDHDWRLATDLPHYASWLLDYVELAPEVSSTIVQILADVVLVDSYEHGREVVNHDPRLRAVCVDGTMWGHGWVAVGSAERSAVEIAAEIDQAEKDLEVARLQRVELAGTLNGAHQAADEARVRSAQAQAVCREQEIVVENLSRRVEAVSHEAEARKQELRRHALRVQEAQDRLSQLRQLWEETSDRLSRVEEDNSEEEPSTSERDEAAAALSHMRSMEVEARLSLRTAQDKAEHIRGRGDGLRRQAEYERQARARHDQAVARQRRKAEIASVVAQQCLVVAERVDDALARATQWKENAIAQRGVISARVSAAKDTVSALRTNANRLTEKSHAAELSLGQAQVRLEEAHEKIVEQLGIAISDLMRDYTPHEGFDIGAQRVRLKNAEKDLNALGKVNPLALEEFKALEERYEFLSTQLADVEQARRDLHGVINDVDAKILQLFTDAWKDVEAEFPRVFATLFPGGEGRLVLTEPHDMLTTGIEVEARPPGKRVKRLSLLSGGEKSLTALAMLVAIFRARPSPFYVMDEVEAALDDVNLRRLIALFQELRDDSQLIVITHQKPTMDVANVLYGVTMRGDGITRVISQRMTPDATKLPEPQPAE
ncbi:chromosome segregation protein SMC [Corynebacterium diphtheriae]|nr:chromosome segregation protein SMC [Corynebacterium diphtheriae]CAB0650155.1 chromosome segregation protein SMC [Corynebacterium diphtheriae]CAB0756140.1 chromosome segregation protein SMC [Corynebacterium diphtheriae]